MVGNSCEWAESEENFAKLPKVLCEKFEGAKSRLSRDCEFRETNYSNFSEAMREYHDGEWGVPLYDDRKLFEFLIMEGAQAGLNWLTILKKREGYRKAFDDFDFEKIAKYGEDDFERLREDGRIVRNRLKIRSATRNAKVFIEIRREFRSFDKYIWRFVGGKQIVNKFKSVREIPSKTDLSDEISEDLKKRGMNFVGSTIVYAFMQAIGLVNDHVVGCPRWREV